VELRQTLWQFIARLNKEGHTVLLTTHYLEEAEALCGRIAMLKAGRMVALAHTSELLKAASSNVLRFKLDTALPAEFEGKARVTGRIVQLPAHDAHDIERYLAIIREAGLRVEDVEVRKADLEDVFLDVMSAGYTAKTDTGRPSGGAADAPDRPVDAREAGIEVPAP
jgi:ABC-2 type transport system ATP-binding protein